MDDPALRGLLRRLRTEGRARASAAHARRGQDSQARTVGSTRAPCPSSRVPAGTGTTRALLAHAAPHVAARGKSGTPERLVYPPPYPYPYLLLLSLSLPPSLRLPLCPIPTLTRYLPLPLPLPLALRVPLSIYHLALARVPSPLPPVAPRARSLRAARSPAARTTSPIRLLTKILPLASPLHRLRSVSTRGGVAAEAVGRGKAMQPTAKRQRPPDALGDEMKQYEAETCDAVVDMSRPCVVRLDGHWCVVVLSANTPAAATATLPLTPDPHAPAASPPTPRASAVPTTRALTRRWSPPPPTCSSASAP